MSETTGTPQLVELTENELILIQALEKFLVNFQSDRSLGTMPSSSERMYVRIVLAKGQVTMGNLQVARDHLREAVSNLWYGYSTFILDPDNPSELSMSELSIINCLRVMINFLEEKKLGFKLEEVRCYLDVAERFSKVNVDNAREHLRKGICKFSPFLEQLIVPKEAS